jgi:hypothetical protein
MAANEAMSVWSGEASMRPGVKGTFSTTPAFFAACPHARAARERDQVGEGNFLAATRAGVELLLNAFEDAQHVAELRRLIDGPIVLRGEADVRAVAPSALVGAPEGGPPGPRQRARGHMSRWVKLEQRTGEGVGELRGVLEEALRILS